MIIIRNLNLETYNDFIKCGFDKCLLSHPEIDNYNKTATVVLGGYVSLQYLEVSVSVPFVTIFLHSAEHDGYDIPVTDFTTIEIV